MPLTNVYVSEGKLTEQLKGLSAPLAEEIARQLTVTDRKITSSDVSIRIIESSSGSKMIAPIEVEIVARLYKERIDKADQVCMMLRDFMLSRLKGASDLRVNLVLSELAHS